MGNLLKDLGNKQVAMRLGVLTILLIMAMIVLTAKTNNVGSASRSDDSINLPSTGRIVNGTRMGNESARVSVLPTALSGLPPKFQPQYGEIITTNVAEKLGDLGL